MGSEAKRHVFLDNLRGLAIVMVVGLHSVSYVNLPDDFSKFIEVILVTTAVPVFFLVDGYIFSSKFSDKSKFNYLEYFRNSVYRLLLPWVVFSIMFLFLRYIGEGFGIFSEVVILNVEFSQLANKLYFSEISSQLYFLLSLFFIRACSKVTIGILSLSRWGVFIFYMLYIIMFLELDIIEYSKGRLDPIVHALWGMQYYILGVLLYKIDVIRLYRLNYFLAFAVFLVILNILEYRLPSIQIVCLIGLFYVSMKHLGHEMHVTSLGRQTMGVYLLHMPIVLYLVVVISSVFSSLVFLHYAIVWMFTLWISYALSSKVSQYRCGRIAFGILR